MKTALSTYLSRELSDFDQIWYADVDYNFHDGHLTKNRNFAYSRWRTAAILKTALSPYLSRELSDFDQISYAYANFHFEDGYLTKIEIFQIQDGGLTPY